MKKIRALIQLLFSSEWLLITGERLRNIRYAHDTLMIRKPVEKPIPKPKAEKTTEGGDFDMAYAKQIINTYSVEYWLLSAEMNSITGNKFEYLSYQRKYISDLFEEAIKHRWGFPRQAWQMVLVNVDKAIEITQAA